MFNYDGHSAFIGVSFVYASKQHVKLPIVIKIPVTLWQIVSCTPEKDI